MDLIGDRVAAEGILLLYHKGNIDQEPSKLVPLLTYANENIIVWRGVKSPIEGGLDFITELDKGNTVTITRLTSTGATPDVAVNFCGWAEPDKLCTILKINLPKGFPYIDVNDSIRSTKLFFQGEKEYLLLPVIGLRKLTFQLVNKTISPSQTDDTKLIQEAILKDKEEMAEPYKTQAAKLEKRFVIYEVNATYTPSAGRRKTRKSKRRSRKTRRRV